MSVSKETDRAVQSRERIVPLVRRRETIKAVVEGRMRHSGYYELREVSCDFHEGVLTLRGCVASYYLKQLAQSLALHLDGVEEINNKLEVPPPQPRTASGTRWDS
jgi:osmotically-inducible protein OsmY